jgi:hypothetical protein
VVVNKERAIMEKQQLSFSEFIETPDTRYDEVETPRGIIKLGSVSSADILEWFDENDDPIKKRFAGLRLVVKSIVNPDGSRIPEDQREAAVAALAKHDSFENGRLAQACLVLNGLRAKMGKGALVKNDQSEVPSGASPTDSPLPPVASM